MKTSNYFVFLGFSMNSVESRFFVSMNSFCALVADFSAALWVLVADAGRESVNRLRGAMLVPTQGLRCRQQLRFDAASQYVRP